MTTAHGVQQQEGRPHGTARLPVVVLEDDKWYLREPQTNQRAVMLGRAGRSAVEGSGRSTTRTPTHGREDPQRPAFLLTAAGGWTVGGGCRLVASAVFRGSPLA
jgi:hypothetical protein